MIKLESLIFLSLFCILHEYKIECKVLKAARTKPSENNGACLTLECKNAASIILQNIDPKVMPCDDFYKFACGNFLKNTVVPKDVTVVDRDSLIGDKIQQQLKISIEEKVQLHEPRSITLAKNLYKACMNTVLIEKNGLQTLLGKLKEMGGWPVLEGDSWNEENFDWKQLTYDMRKFGFEIDYLFNFIVLGDNSVRNKLTLNIDQPSFPLEREDLVEGLKNTKVKAYYDFMVDIAVDFGANRARAERELKEALGFEIKLASITITDEDPTNQRTLDYKKTVAQLAKIYPSVPWKEYFNSILKSTVIVDNDIVSVIVPSFFEKFQTLIKETPKRVLANFLLWKGAEENLGFLTDNIKNRQLKFFAADAGQAKIESKARWKDCLGLTTAMLPASIGALFVRKNFNPESKKSAEALVANIKQQFKTILKKVEWMDEKTKAIALDKLEAMDIFTGYPNELLNDKTLDELYKEVEITTDNYLQSVLNLNIYLTDDIFREFRMPGITKKWTSHCDSSLAVALYNKFANNFNIPAAVLQDIFFNKDRPQYLNYAAIGSTIGHEITHGFDNQGGAFDKIGNSTEWFSPETKKKLSEKVDCIIKQYGNYTAEEVGLKLNGNNTQDENVADNGGVKISYLAYQDWVKQNGPEPKLPGLNYSQSQLFWIQAAIRQCGKYTLDSLKDSIANDNKSPAEFRVIGSFANRPEFAKDFNCPLGSRMNPVKKCSVW